MDNMKPIPLNIHLQNTSIRFESNITYELEQAQDPHQGYIIPMLLGQGRFAKVYSAWQRSSDRNVRRVAIKILHEHVDLRAEELSLQEIKLLKDLTASANENVISTIDIIRVGPSAMCGGCGKLYHPLCPSCGQGKLVRYQPRNQAYPALRCEHDRCTFTLSAEHIATRYTELLRAPAKTCCTKGPHAQHGTLINFVDREAVVMELLNTKLTQFHQQRSRMFARLCERHGISDSTAAIPPVSKTPGVEWRDEQPVHPSLELLRKVRLLEKIRLLVQLAESISWLHGEKHIVHKDLAPDNIMVSSRNADKEDSLDRLESDHELVEESLQNLATQSTFTTKVIDFGLADQHQLSRNWYEEPASFLFAANEKLPYLSSESRNRKIKLNQRIEFDLDGQRFRVPENLIPHKAGELALMRGDILADERDPQHHYYVVVSEVLEQPEGSGQYWAKFDDSPPPQAHTRQYDLIRPLGEAHDIYALGAIFYFILTGEHTEVEKIGHLAGSLQYTPQRLEPESLAVSQPLYKCCRSRLPEPYYRDQLLILILRAMVRGLEDSFVHSRIERGPEPAQRLLHGARQIYNQLLADILSDSVRLKQKETERQLDQLRDSYQRVTGYQRIAWGVVCMGLPFSAAAGWLLSHLGR
jgi:serine/threonine protein kinase